MTDAQKHIHYVKTPFFQKLFYVCVGLVIYHFAFAGGCDKVRKYTAHATNTVESVKTMYNNNVESAKKLYACLEDKLK